MRKPKEQRPEVEVVWERADEGDHPVRGLAQPRNGLSVVAVLAVVVVAVAVVGGLLDGGERETDRESGPPTTVVPNAAPGPGAPDRVIDDGTRWAGAVSAESLPAPLVAAEMFVADPDRGAARSLLEAIGGIDSLVVGTAEGAFDLVTFDPLDPGHLLASRRSSYGPAENQHLNQEWFVSNGEVRQKLFAPDLEHDVVHFTRDGSVAIWANSGSSTGFSSRTVTIDSGSGMVTVGPHHASRSVIVGATLFALTGSEDYYATNVRFESLVADRPGGPAVVLDSGAAWSWVDSPDDAIVVAYPSDRRAGTKVWDSSSLEPIPDHRFAGRPYQRIALSGDGRIAVAVTNDDQLEAMDATRGTIIGRFGSLNPQGISRPVTVNHDGTIAITVDRDGTLTVWWVGHDQPLAVIAADAGPARVVAEHRAPRASSAVEPSAERIAVRARATPDTPMTWRIIDTDIARWIERACSLAGSSLDADQRRRLGLPETPTACG